MKLKYCFVALTVLLFSTVLKAQNLSVKTNLLYDAVTAANLGLEYRIATHWSVDLSGNLKCWDIKEDRRTRHILVQPELRYWFCEQSNGSFVALHGIYAHFNYGNIWPAGEYRYQGDLGGAGLAYGYSMPLNRSWNIEAEVGAGYVYAIYDKYPCHHCGKKISDGRKGFFAPTKAAISLVYTF